MPITIFYSWQSDRPSKTNWTFIKRALDIAVSRINAELPVEEAARVDQDTQGIPGSPSIADVILKKIDECGIFVPDLTFVGAGEKDKLLPNPNVMIEYGYALKAVGDRRIIAVFNEAYGLPQKLPFDIGHKRWPIIYHASTDDAPQALKSECIKLSAQLEKELRVILDAGVAGNASPRFSAIEAKDSSSSFLASGESITPQREREDGDKPGLWLAPGARLYMRLIPTIAAQTLTNVDAWDLVRAEPLVPMSIVRSGGSFSYARNRYGALSYESLPSDPSVVVSFSQLFKNRELWAIDTDVLSQERVKRYAPDVNFPVLPTGYLETACNGILRNFLLISRNHLKPSFPLKLEVGMSGLWDFRLALDSHRFGEKFDGYIHERDLTWSEVITGYEEQPSTILLPFYNYVWDAAGLRRPKD